VAVPVDPVLAELELRPPHAAAGLPLTLKVTVSLRTAAELTSVTAAFTEVVLAVVAVRGFVVKVRVTVFATWV
jgi:hypothetical protein